MGAGFLEGTVEIFVIEESPNAHCPCTNRFLIMVRDLNVIGVEVGRINLEKTRRLIDLRVDL